MSNVWTDALPAATEMAYTRKETINFRGENEASVTLRCAWADRYTLAVDLINRLYPGGGGRLGASVSIAPVANGAYTVTNGEMIYEQADVTVSYDVADAGSLEEGTHPGTGGTVLYRESLEWTLEFTKLDHNDFTWTDANGRVLTAAEAPYRSDMGLALKRTVYGLAALSADLLTIPGKVNNAAYASVSLGLTFPTGTLLFGKPVAERTVNTNGDKRWNLTTSMAYKEKTWNKFWRTDKAGDDKYDEIYGKTAATVYKNFPSASFANFLF